MKTLEGVNLGGWLVLEKWMTPSLFQECIASDEYGLCQEAENKDLSEHQKTFITEQDFKWLHENGVQAVRIPIGYWIFGDYAPFPSGIESLKWVFVMAKKYDIQILIDLHGALGSQNGWDHSGQAGKMRWHKNSDFQKQTLDVLERLAKEFGQEENLFGIELLNEPHWDISISTLKDFYKEGYKRVRQYTDAWIVIHDSFRPKRWQSFMNKPSFTKVALDMHLYQCFSFFDKRLSMASHLKKAQKWKDLISSQDLPVIIGEWSLALDPKTFKNMGGDEQKAALQEYGKAQLEAFEHTIGYFYWSYKLEDQNSTWNFKSLIENNIIVL
jgi:glucan 1,3-beta-glucosidase